MSHLVSAINRHLYLIDGYDLGSEERTGTYVLVDKPEVAVTLIETGPSSSNKHIKKGLEELGISLSDIKWVIVTHIHLDHSGGAGLLLSECPNAKLIVHPKGARHLIDPTKLIKGAKAVYGDSFDKLFSPVLPVEKDRIIEKTDNSTLTLTKDRTLTFIDTPGHSRHHFSIYDSKTLTMFTGDTIGIRYPSLERDGSYLYLPSTSPNQFDPEEMLLSIEKIESMKPMFIAFGHYGLSTHPNLVYKQIRYWLPIFLKLGKESLEKDLGHEGLKEELLVAVNEQLKKDGIKNDHTAYKMIHLDLNISAMGILDYLKKQS
ncbi:MBL fold metallo-hydrolase [Evansella halocellulosilytica]|uniref:MBL fold metallo-hydrolase n=1 Tax=Evansella halocellulosilytica TaxID=2011013 RepID=UPI000BB7B3F7|nr:MBL fold metallo-hydrolase [Evansella halocellulosilytica]